MMVPLIPITGRHVSCSHLSAHKSPGNLPNRYFPISDELN